MRRLEADIHQFRNSPSRWTPAVSSDPAATVGYADTTYFSETGLSPATQYWFRVVSTDGSNHYSIASNVVISVTGPSISISASTGDSENTATTLTTSVTVAAGEVDPETSWSINWGDGDTQTYTGSATLTGNTFTSNIPHTYTTPGQYTITASTTDGLFTGTAETTVTDAIGTVSLVNDSGNDYLAGDTFGVTASYNGNPVNQWVVDWGDGSNSVTSSSGGTNSATDLTHTYADSYGDSTATPATGFNVTVSAETNDGVYASSEVVTISPNGSSSVYTPPTELNSAPVVSAPVELVANVGDSVTFYAGVTGLSLSPSADPIAFVDWGNNGISLQVTLNVQSGNPSDGVVVATLSSAPAGGLTPKFTIYEPGNASEDVSDKSQVMGTLDTPSGYIDEGESNDLLIASPDGTQNLQPVVFNFPGVTSTETPTLTVTSTDTTEDVLWDTPTPAAGATPLLGGSGPTTYTTALAAGQTSATFWAGALVGDTTPNVDSYEGTVTIDAPQYNACTAMGESEAGFVPEPFTAEIDMTATTVHAGSNGSLTISLVTNPNNGQNNVDVTNNGANPTKWLVGQFVSLQAGWTGPSPLEVSSDEAWSFNGNSNVLYGIDEASGPVTANRFWRANANRRVIIPLSWDDGPYRGTNMDNPYHHVPDHDYWGLHESDIKFFWVATSQPGATDPVTVQLTVHPATLWPSANITASTQFLVSSPTPNVIVSQGSPKVGVIHGEQAMGLLGPTFTVAGVPGGVAQHPSGIIYNAQVVQPAGFAGGTYRIVQKIKPYANQQNWDGTTFRSPFQGFWVLDQSDPLPSEPFDPYGANAGWPTGAGWHWTGDAPSFPPPDCRRLQLWDSFDTYLMYCPPGAGSNWVPLEDDQWSFEITEYQTGKGNGVWVPFAPIEQNTWKNIPNFAPATVEPEWDNVLKSPYRLK